MWALNFNDYQGSMRMLKYSLHTVVTKKET